MSKRGHTDAKADAGESVTGRALDARLLLRIAACTWPHRRRMLLGLLLLPLAAFFELAQPYLLKIAIDEHIAAGRLAGLDTIALAFFGALLGQHAAGYAQLVLVQSVGQRAMNDLRLDAYRHLLRLCMSFFDRTSAGRTMARLTNDIEALSEMFASGVITLAADVIKLAAILIVIFKIDWRLAAFSMFTAPVLFGIATLFRRVVRDAFRQVRAQMARLNGFLQEHISGMKVLQAFAREDHASRAFDEVNRAYRQASSRAITADAALYAIVEAVGSIATAALIWHGGGRIALGTLTLGTLVAFIDYLAKFFGPIRDLSTKYTVMQQAMAAAERVFALLDDPDVEPAKTEAKTDATIAPGQPLVAFEDVSFGYRADAPVLRRLSFEVRQGETVALVGLTGAGKSTVAKLLSRLYEPDAGRVLLGGRDVRDVPLGELRRRVLVLNQDVHLFSGTLGANIDLGDPAVDAAARDRAARLTGAHVVAERRPGGFDNRIAERGADLSAGERQLIAFARAMVRTPEVLVLDEATASVDPETERLVEAGVAELMRGRTSIVIAHRLSTIRRADRIVVLHEGHVTHAGTHDELLASDGIYRRFVEAAAGPPASRA